MQLPRFDFLQPRSLQEACSILREGNGKVSVLAGGTAFMVALRSRLHTPSAVISTKALSELSYIREASDGGLVIGAMTTLEALENSPLVANGYAVLGQAARFVGVPPIRHVATVGGNLCLDTRCIFYNQSEFWRKARPDCFKLGGDVCHAIDKGRRCLAVYQGDLAPALVALGARVRIVGVSGEKAIPLTQFYTGNGEKPNVLEPGDILAEVQIPPSSGNTWGGYEKLRVREGMDFPLAGVAVSIKTNANGAIDQARLVLGAVAPSPLEVPEATELLVGQKLTDSLLESVAQKAYDRARPVANLAVDASYRRKMVRVLVKRAIGRAVSGNG